MNKTYQNAVKALTLVSAEHRDHLISLAYAVDSVSGDLIESARIAARNFARIADEVERRPAFWTSDNPMAHSAVYDLPMLVARRAALLERLMGALVIEGGPDAVKFVREHAAAAAKKAVHVRGAGTERGVSSGGVR